MSRDNAFHRAASALADTVQAKTEEMRIVWADYRDADPRKALVGDLIADLEAEPATALSLERLEAVAQVLDDGRELDQRVLEALRDLAPFVELATRLAAAASPAT